MCILNLMDAAPLLSEREQEALSLHLSRYLVLHTYILLLGENTAPL